MIQLDLYGDPIAQPRVRFVNRGKYATAYDPAAKIKEGFAWQLKSQYRDEPLSVPVLVDIIFFMPIPKSTSKVKKRAMLNGAIYHIKKPDVDNLTKLVLDCLNKIVFHDDSQVIEMRARKVYSSKPGTHIKVFPIHTLKENALASSTREV